MAIVSTTPVTLRDGSAAGVRPIRPQDAEPLRAGFAKLSPESRYRRFLTGAATLSDAEVRYLTEVDHHDHEALVALSPDGEGIGVARYVRDPSRPGTAEAAVTVVDAWQGMGVGTALLGLLADRARAEGLERFTAVLLEINGDMLDLFEDLGPVRVLERGAGTMEVEVSLPPSGVGAHLSELLRGSADGRYRVRHAIGSQPMEEIAPGILYWSAPHPRIHATVSTYYLREERVLLDPMIPPAEGLAWFRSAPPQHIVLTNRHHDRDAWRIREEYGTTVHCISNGVHELAGRGPVEPFEFGDELPGGIVVHEVGAICPDETALHIPAHRALACADGVVRWPGVDGLACVPDELMDEPEQTKRRLKAAYGELLELDFDLLLLAHGAPVLEDAREQLRAFVNAA